MENMCSERWKNGARPLGRGADRHCTILYYTILYYTILYYTYYTILYYIS